MFRISGPHYHSALKKKYIWKIDKKNFFVYRRKHIEIQLSIFFRHVGLPQLQDGSTLVLHSAIFHLLLSRDYPAGFSFYIHAIFGFHAIFVLLSYQSVLSLKKIYW